MRYNHKHFLVDLNDYKPIKKLDSGSFGRIFKVEHVKTKVKYAAKVCTDGYKKSSSQELINREVGILMRLNHPSIVKFYGYSLLDFDKKKNVTIIMQLAEKKSFFDYIYSDDFGSDNTQLQKILIGIARGMMYLHQNHIIHRDLKPENVLLDSNYNPLITDFGFAKVIDDFGQNTLKRGTFMFMAPEVVKGKKYNGKADVFSFGILLFQAVTGSNPYTDLKLDDSEVAQKVANEDLRPKFEKKTKNSFKHLINQCLDKDPTKRPTFEEIFNKLAFNIEKKNSIYDDLFDDDEHECKYYLDGVNEEEVLAYADQLIRKEKKNEFVFGDQMDEMQSQLEKMQAQIEKMKKRYNEEIEKLKNENKELMDENREIKKQLEKVKSPSKPRNQKKMSMMRSRRVLRPKINKKEDKKNNDGEGDGDDESSKAKDDEKSGAGSDDNDRDNENKGNEEESSKSTKNKNNKKNEDNENDEESGKSQKNKKNVKSKNNEGSENDDNNESESDEEGSKSKRKKNAKNKKNEDSDNDENNESDEESSKSEKKKKNAKNKKNDDSENDEDNENESDEEGNKSKRKKKNAKNKNNEDSENDENNESDEESNKSKRKKKNAKNKNNEDSENDENNESDEEGNKSKRKKKNAKNKNNEDSDNNENNESDEESSKSEKKKKNAKNKKNEDSDNNENNESESDEESSKSQKKKKNAKNKNNEDSENDEESGKSQKNKKNVKSKNNEGSENDEGNESESDEEGSKSKRKKKNAKNKNNEDSENDENNESDEESSKSEKKKKNAKNKKNEDSENDEDNENESDDEDNKSKKKKKNAKNKNNEDSDNDEKSGKTKKNKNGRNEESSGDNSKSKKNKKGDGDDDEEDENQGDDDDNTEVDEYEEEDEEEELEEEDQNDTEKRKSTITIDYKPRSKFDGIFKYLTDENRGYNVHDSKTIEITTNSCPDNKSHPKYAVDSNKDHEYCSGDKKSPPTYVCFNFKEMKVMINKYVIESSHRSNCTSFLKNWSIQGSKDAKKWVDIDVQKNNSDLNKPSKIAVFEPNKPKKVFFQYIRLLQTGNSWFKFSNKRKISFCQIEFFGKVLHGKKKRFFDPSLSQKEHFSD